MPENDTRVTCSCGHDLSHPNVLPERSYGILSSMLLLGGASARPKRIDYRCQRCRQVLASTRDPVALEKHLH